MKWHAALWNEGVEKQRLERKSREEVRRREEKWGGREEEWRRGRGKEKGRRGMEEGRGGGGRGREGNEGVMTTTHSLQILFHTCSSWYTVISCDCAGVRVVGGGGKMAAWRVG